MKKLFVKTLLLIQLLVFSFIYPSSIKNIKDTYVPLKKEYQDLSPLYGASWWENPNLLENLYKFGMDQDSTIKLIKELFHVTSGSFDVTRLGSKAAYHLSGATIGKIIGLIKKKEKEEKEITQKGLIRLIKEDIDYKASINSVLVVKKQYQEKLKEIEEQIQSLKNSPEIELKKINADDYRDKMKNLEDNKNYYTKLINARNITIATGESLNDLCDAIVGSCDECGYFGQEKALKRYPKYSTQAILLAFLYRKDYEQQVDNIIKDKEKYRKYFNELENYLAENKFLEINELAGFKIGLSKVSKAKLNLTTKEQKKALEEKIKGLESNLSEKEKSISNELVKLKQKKLSKTEKEGLIEEIQKRLQGVGIFKIGDWKNKVLESSGWLIDEFPTEDENFINNFIKNLEVSTKDKANDSLDKILDSLSKSEKLSVDQIYEKLICVSVIKKYYQSALPKIAKWKMKIKYKIGSKEVLFPDCVETVVRNLCNIVIYDDRSNQFILPKDVSDEKIKTFYSKNNLSSDVDSRDVADAWTAVVEDREFVTYNGIIKQDTLTKKKGGNTFIKVKNVENFLEKIEEENKSKINILGKEFNEVTINKQKYVVVYSDEYAVYELMPSLKNIIILLNEFFNLNLYNNLEAVFFDETFNSDYFPKLCRKLGWRIYSENIDYNRDTSLDIKLGLKNSNNQFLIKLTSGHGELNKLEEVKIERYEKTLYEFSEKDLEASIVLYKNLPLILLYNNYSDDFECYYNKPPLFNNNVFRCVRYFPVFIKNLNGINEKLSIVNCISLKDKYSRNLALKIMISFHTVENLFKTHQLKIIRYYRDLINVSKELDSELIGKLFENAILIVKSGIESGRPKVIGEVVSLGIAILNFIDVMLEKDEISEKDKIIEEDKIVKYFIYLIKLDQYELIKAAIDSCNELFKSDEIVTKLIDSLIDIIKHNDDIVEYALKAYIQLLSEGKGFDRVFDVLREIKPRNDTIKKLQFNIIEVIVGKLVNDKQYASQINVFIEQWINEEEIVFKYLAVELCRALAKGDKNFDIVIDFVNKSIQCEDQYFLFGLLDLVSLLVEKNKGVEQALAVLEKASKSNDIIIQERVMRLARQLIQKEIGIEEVIKITSRAIKFKNKEGFTQVHAILRLNALSLFADLFKLGKGFDEALILSKEMILSDPSNDINLPFIGRRLLKQLWEYDRGFDVAFDIAKKKIESDDKDDQKLSLDLFISLVSKGKAFEEAMLAAEKGILSDDWNVSESSLNLFKILLEKKQGVNEAIKIIEANASNDKYLLKKNLDRLAKKLYELNKLSKEDYDSYVSGK